MCEPTIAMFAVSAVSTIASTVQQTQAANAQVDAQERQAEAAIKANQFEQSTLRIRQGQEQEATAQEKFRSDQASNIAISEATTQAADANVSGASVDALIAGYHAENLRYQTALDRQQEFKDVGTELNLRGSGIQLDQTLDQLSTPVAGPSYLSAALDIGAAGIDAYSNYKQTTG